MTILEAVENTRAADDARVIEEIATACLVEIERIYEDAMAHVASLFEARGQSPDLEPQRLIEAPIQEPQLSVEELDQEPQELVEEPQELGEEPQELAEVRTIGLLSEAETAEIPVQAA